MTSSTGTSASSSGRQKRMGPAPFASFEDLSDELESPDDKDVSGSVVRLPGIREDLTPSTPAHMDRSPSPAFKGISLIGAVVARPNTNVPNNTTSTSSQNVAKETIKPPCMPRIDISRASSSSHHDSRDSSPEREIFDTPESNDAKLGLGFKEDGALDLRSSTEELDFQDLTEKKKSKARPQSPMPQEECVGHTRKDSQCSDIVLLSISGRTSRLSSIGSQGSAHSGQSRLSNASHISVMSNQSGLSRCSSPHKMILETSFCGTKTADYLAASGEDKGTKADDIEKIILARKHDPTAAIVAEGISTEPISTKIRPEKPIRKQIETIKSDIKITVDKPCNDSNKSSSTTTISSNVSSKIVSESGVEYIYIPLKGPLPADLSTSSTTNQPRAKQKLREVKSAQAGSRSPSATKTAKTLENSAPKSKSATPSPVVTKRDEEPKYIRIRLKPDRCYSDEKHVPEIQKPDSLELDKIETSSNYIHETTKKVAPSSSPKLTRSTVVTENVIESVTPSPSVSRRSSFASLFKNKDVLMSPESPSVPGHRRKNTITGILREASDNIRTRSRSRSKSRDRDSHKSSLSTAPSSTESIDSKSKHKSVLSLFKSGKKDKMKAESETSSQETLPSIEGIGKVEFKFNESKIKTRYEHPLEAASIRIPLHSPEYYDNRSISQDWKTSSQDSQETVIEAPSKQVDVVVEPIKKFDEAKPHIEPTVVNKNSRQNSTSSENIVFTTELGNENEVFTTKLPKKLREKDAVTKMTIADREVTVVEVNGIYPTNFPKQEVAIKPQSSSNEQISIKQDVVSKQEVIARQISREFSRESIKTVRECVREKLPQSKSKTSSKESETNELEAKELETTELETENYVNPNAESESMQIEETMEDKRISTISESALSTISSNADDDRISSDSEREPEELARSKRERDLKLDLDVSEPERKAIVLQDSFEDELPYIPTTLPQERSAAIPIVPIKQRSTFEMRTCPIERPRSTTPINPSCLEEYCEEVMGNFNVDSVTKTIEKLKICLPKKDSVDKGSKVLSPRKKESNNWQEFAEKGFTRSTPTHGNETPPPLPPKGIQKAWINFEDIPEKRKTPKRIQTIPSRSYIEVPDSLLQDSVLYNYVNPDECKCECHELNAKGREKKNGESQTGVQEDELPLLDEDIPDDDKNGPDTSEKTRLEVTDSRSVISDSSVDLSTSIDQQDASGAEPMIRTPFTSDLGLSSNRSSIVSQEEQQSPGSPNAFPKIS